jgi:hypothetical protein
MKLSLLALLAVLIGAGSVGNLSAVGQQPVGTLGSPCVSGDPCRRLSPHAEQVAGILEVKSLVEQALVLRSNRPAGAAMTVEELALREEISEAVLAASFDVDGVLAEIEQERAHIAEVSSFLQARRDRGVNLASVASLITGSGVGIAVNALQFSSSTADIGNGIGVGSGAASTALSLIGIRLQRGPKRQIGPAPNMLAIPFGRKPVLFSDYPEDVLAYLNSVPPGESPDRGTRLEQLIHEWIALGRLDPVNTPKGQKEVDLMTSSLSPKQKLRIDDLTNRAMMLADLAGRVSLMKRDLAELMRALRH